MNIIDFKKNPINYLNQFKKPAISKKDILFDSYEKIILVFYVISSWLNVIDFKKIHIKNLNEFKKSATLMLLANLIYR